MEHRELKTKMQKNTLCIYIVSEEYKFVKNFRQVFNIKTMPSVTILLYEKKSEIVNRFFKIIMIEYSRRL